MCHMTSHSMSVPTVFLPCFSHALRAHACQHQPVILVMEAQLAVLSSSKRLLADAGAPAVPSPAPDAAMLADAGAPAVLAPAPLAVMLADACAPAAPLAVVLTDAGGPAVVALAPDAVMLADAGALAVLALVPLSVVLAFHAPPPRLRCAHPLSRWKGPQVRKFTGRSRGRACGGGLAAHEAGEGTVEQRVAAGGGRRGRWHVVQ